MDSSSNSDRKVRDIHQLTLVPSRPRLDDSPGEYFSIFNKSIEKHRSMFSLELLPRDALGALLLTLFITVLFILLLPEIAAFWKLSLQFGLDFLGMPYSTSYERFTIGSGLQFDLPFIEVPTPRVTPLNFILVSGATIIFFVGSFFISKHKVPAIYGLRLLALLQGSSIAFFCIYPNGFPYSLAGFLFSNLKINLAFLAIVPWIMGITYFIFNIPFAKKIGFSFLTILYFIIEIPVQYFVHFTVLHFFSMLMAPTVFAIFGLSFQVFLFMGLYSWAMSWE